MFKKEEVGFIGFMLKTGKAMVCIHCTGKREKNKQRKTIDYNTPIDEFQCGLWTCCDCDLRIT
jgi:hypothetical protein